MDKASRDDIAADLFAELLPATLWMLHFNGLPANVCIEAALVLHHAYRYLGIPAQPRTVDLWVHDQRTGRETLYGRPDPRWTTGGFQGHCVLWLPRSRRLLDPTVEQYPEVRRYRWGPICGSMVGSMDTTPEYQAKIDMGVLPGGSQIGVQRGEMVLLYTLVEDAYDKIATQAPHVVEHTAEYQRAGRNLASQVLILFRQPEIIAKVREAPYPHLHALLDTIGDAQERVDSDGDSSFEVAGPDGSPQYRDLDQITASASAPSVDPSIQAILEDTAVRVMEVPEQHHQAEHDVPTVLLEIPRAVMASPHFSSGNGVELQAKFATQRGFGLFIPGASLVPTLADWSLEFVAGRVKLLEGEEGVWAEGDALLSDVFLRRARHSGLVQVIYGVQLGIPTTPGNDNTFDDAALSNSRAAGHVVSAFVPWHAPTATEDRFRLFGRKSQS